MVLDQQTKMSESETDALLSAHETAVLSLADDDTPYAIPISYGYDATNRRFYMRLVSTPESEKRRFLSSAPMVRLVVHDQEDTVYRSAVAVGTLHEISPDEVTVEHIVQYGNAKRPLFEIWGQAKDNLDIKLYELDPDDIGGRRVEIDQTANA
ncbi:pyridoxamine 5'-phosphate oxidase family protein [Haladaptatus sp. ZSTT2]|uniref:pyridoxamine 5'-phosphate oxidase family protein n=1 Tax=Haladaptatus sp. ZSTT2 TaxID=3120515 RepID=UPI00300F614E